MATFTNWQQLILKSLGAPATPQNVKFLNAWATAEGGSASFNPFNTTQYEPGASSYNSVGVRNYVSPSQGVKATVDTLLNGRYNNIVNDLRSGKASAMRLARDEAATPWGTGSLIEKVLGGPVSAPAPQNGGGHVSAKASAMQRLAGGGANSLGPLSSFLTAMGMQALSGQSTPQQQGQTLLQLALMRRAMGG